MTTRKHSFGKSLSILITGGAGFIGSAMVRYLIEHTSHQVINIDSLTYAGHLESLITVERSPRYRFEKINICNAQEIQRILKQYQPDLIINFAAESHVDRSINDAQQFIQTNILGTYTFLEQVRSYYDKLKQEKQKRFRFHHISTDEVYGDLPHPDDKNIDLPLFKETTPYAPRSPYSASKASSDHLVRAWYTTYGLPTLITHCSNNYGPYQFPEKLIPLTILNALENKAIPIYGNGYQIRDWLYVDDHVRALLLVAKQGDIGQTFNIGGNVEKRNLEVVTTICDTLEELHPSRLATYSSLVTHIDDRLGHDKRYATDTSKIEKHFGWVPIETFESGIRKTVQWYLDNLEWCQQVRNNSYQRELQ